MTVVTPPDVVTHPILEYEALTHHVGLLDLPHVGVLRLTGNDRVRFLNAMVTNDVAALAKGTSCVALLTTTKGRVVAELLVLADAESLRVLVLQGSTERVAEALESHIIADDVTLENLSATHAVLSLEGPKCRDLVWRLFPREPLPIEPFKFTENAYQGMTATVVRHSVTGEKGLHMIIPRAHHERLRSYLEQGGVGMDMAVLGRAAWNMRRVEAGLPWYGVDVSEDNFPKEARLDDAVSYNKGCYVGQETIARMHYRGHPNWLLVGLSPVGEVPSALRWPDGFEKPGELSSLTSNEAAVRAHTAVLAFANVPVIGAELFDAAGAADAKSAGRITSAVFSPKLKQALFLGYVRAALATPESRFRLQLGSETASLSVVDLPLKGDTKHA